MSIKSLKLDRKKIFQIIYLVIILSNLIAALFLFQFVRNNVYGAVFVDPDYLAAQKIKSSGDLDLNKFDAVVSLIEQKQEPKPIEDIKNVFD
ncbi:MAG: hypothetical protein NTW06_01515 [Candidatus Falkowbacteria bacterium]|nr:hypothetical protein [Candidatus Falkowbacteria bacterium]